MAEQITQNPEALKLFFNEDIYLISSEMLPETAPADSLAMALPPEGPVSQKRTYEYLGKNAKNILILVNDSRYPVSTEEGRELLWKIVKAINLTAKDFAVVNYAACPGSTFDELASFFKPQLLLCFGLGPEALGLIAQEQHVLSQQKSVNTIFSLDLHELNGTLAAKKVLWGSLKQLQIS